MSNEAFNKLYKNKFKKHFKSLPHEVHDSHILEFFKAAFEAGKQSIVLPSDDEIDCANDGETICHEILNGKMHSCFLLGALWTRRKIKAQLEKKTSEEVV